jgi:hypothetical protein
MRTGHILRGSRLRPGCDRSFVPAPLPALVKKSELGLKEISNCHPGYISKGSDALAFSLL